MTKQEFAGITEVIMSFFPKFKDNIDSKIKLNIWYGMLGDNDFKTTTIALKKVLSESEYMPTASKLRQAVADIENPSNSITASEAWGQFKKAMSRFGIYREKMALDAMDNRVSSLISRMGYKDLCKSKNILADRAHFIKLWNAQQQKERNHQALPADVKKYIEGNKERLENLTKMIGN